MTKEEEYALEQENNPPRYCETCQKYSMIYKGTIYFCEKCENWHYSSS